MTAREVETVKQAGSNACNLRLLCTFWTFELIRNVNQQHKSPKASTNLASVEALDAIDATTPYPPVSLALLSLTSGAPRFHLPTWAAR